MGRPGAMTEEKIADLEAAYHGGASDRLACVLAGIARSTLYKHCANEPDFARRRAHLKLVHSTPSPGGRPSKYSQALIDRGHEYVDDGFEVRGVIPTIGGLAEHLGVSKQTLYNWRKHPDRAEEVEWLLERTMCHQAVILISKGLTGEFNAAICKLLLIQNHGFGRSRNGGF